MRKRIKTSKLLASTSLKKLATTKGLVKLMNPKPIYINDTRRY